MNQPIDCIIRIGKEETALPYRKLTTLKRKIAEKAKDLGLRAYTNWESKMDDTYFDRIYWDYANNPVTATIIYINGRKG